MIKILILKDLCNSTAPSLSFFVTDKNFNSQINI